ncbi:hypothetical protein ACED51_10530 [Photobacterium swingsii]|uniref:Uncharacterized protein n=2 Tax=Vibrio TaxID=662 RepID=A0A0H3ZJI6_9VIBR|nr:hypothetical protein [Vibrio tasmaniensis]AKN40818.1 hypothetical protein [Vibrio sp. 1F_189]
MIERVSCEGERVGKTEIYIVDCTPIENGKPDPNRTVRIETHISDLKDKVKEEFGCDYMDYKTREPH